IAPAERQAPAAIGQPTWIGSEGARWSGGGRFDQVDRYLHSEGHRCEANQIGEYGYGPAVYDRAQRRGKARHVVVPAIVLVLSRCLVAVPVGSLHSIIVVMVMLVDGDGIADVTDLMGIPGGRRRGHAERDHGESEQVPDESKSG
ncbi:MAG TPA: hypothetical protein VF782_03425, partial [Allosphingosinicella sp.]